MINRITGRTMRQTGPHTWETQCDHAYKRMSSRIDRSLGCAIITYRCTKCGHTVEEEKEVS